ncbi:MAG: 4-hydroxy-tetrahydrodipicolinate reductase [Candidatus Omnitrophota bacterium]
MIKIAVIGARGRMGQRIIALAEQDSNLDVTAAIENKGHPCIGKVYNKLNISSDSAILQNCDCVIDFSSPSSTLFYLKHALDYMKPLVIGTTGIDKQGIESINDASRTIPVVFSPNMSIGVNVIFELVKFAASILKGYKAAITEAHHVHKKDVPSGTAKKIAEIINSCGLSIGKDEIKSIRENEIVGDHAILFEGDSDTVELRHSAKSRDIFAQGALAAAQWIISKPPGLYSMRDLLLPAKGEDKC